MAKGKSNVVSHPKVTDIDMFGHHLPTSQKVDWVKKTTGMSDSDAQEAVKMMEDYSDTHNVYTAIHKGTNQHGNDVIGKVIDNPKTPVYDKIQFRGVPVTTAWAKNQGFSSVHEYLESIIKSGVWQENGVSSFSATKSTAMSFGEFGHKSPNKVSVLITNHGHTKGMPFKHISNLSSENEVLQSQSTMQKGMKIIGHHWNKAHTELFLEVDDSK